MVPPFLRNLHAPAVNCKLVKPASLSLFLQTCSFIFTSHPVIDCSTSHLLTIATTREAPHGKIRVPRVKERHTVPISTGVVDNAVQIGNISVARQPHHNITKIYHECPWYRVHVHPLRAFSVPNLQPARAILEQDSDGAKVGMCTKSIGFLCFLPSVRICSWQ